MSGATTGKLGLVPDDLNDEWYLNQRVGAFRVPGNTRIQREYLRSLLASPFYQRHVLNLAGGAAQPNISGKQLDPIRKAADRPKTRRSLRMNHTLKIK